MFTITTFNIRLDCGADGKNNFCYRKPLILKKLEAERPDLLCFQEVLPHVAAWLQENLPEYLVLGCGRERDLSGEQMTIAVKKSRFDLVQMETFWLSETPFTPGTLYPEQSKCPRCCTELVLKDLQENKVLRVLNTHLDHVGALARKLGLTQVMKKLASETLFPEAPVVLCGDFNAEPWDPEIQVMQDYPEYTNVTDGIGITYHAYMGSGQTVIDYIFTRSLKTLEVQKWTEEENGVFLSDHYPVWASLQY